MSVAKRKRVDEYIKKENEEQKYNPMSEKDDGVSHVEIMEFSTTEEKSERLHNNPTVVNRKNKENENWHLKNLQVRVERLSYDSLPSSKRQKVEDKINRIDNFQAERGFKCLQVRVERLNIDNLSSHRTIKVNCKNDKVTRQHTASNQSTSVEEKTWDDIRCSDCLQFLDDSDFNFFSGDVKDAVDEMVMLTDKRLSLFTGCEGNDILDAYMEKPQHKITMFSIYDKHKHLCRFDTGLIERNVLLYFSGLVLPIYSEEPSQEDGVPARSLGPIYEWWITGFDGGEKALIGFSTAYAEYILMEPSSEYKSYMQSVMEKIHMAKFVIEFVSQNPDAAIDDLLEKIQNTPSPAGLRPYTQDALLTHSQFIIDQISSYDSAGDDDERLLLTTPCIRSLIRLAGVTLARLDQTRKQMKGNEKIKTLKKSTDTKATTTNLVHKIIGSAFPDQMETMACCLSTKKKKCGVCAGCQQPNCGLCTVCVHRGNATSNGKILRDCLMRVCLNAAVQEAEEDEASSGDEFDDEPEMRTKNILPPSSKYHSKSRKTRSVEWIGKPVIYEKKFYTSVNVNGQLLNCGNYVLVEPQNSSSPFLIAKIEYLFQDGKGEKMFHASWFMRGNETVLGETSHENEIFMVDDCADVSLNDVYSSCQVYQRSPPPNWYSLGGVDDFDESTLKYDGKTFFYQKWYDSTQARFEDPVEIPETIVQSQRHRFCASCYRSSLKSIIATPVFGRQVKCQSNEGFFSSVTWNGYTLELWDCVMLDPSIFKFAATRQSNKKLALKSNVDEDTYPEYYRKTERCKGLLLDDAVPFCIGRIISISARNDVKITTPDSVKLRVNVFYRPENTSLRATSKNNDYNLLYWSNEEANVKLNHVAGKCDVVHGNDGSHYLHSFFSCGQFRFFFEEAYDCKLNATFKVPLSVQKSFYSAKNDLNGTPVKCKTQHKNSFNNEIKLRALDIFAGCGGLSDGFHESGICETRWAIENEPAAAEAFRRNHPKSIVFAEDCNSLLKLIMEGHKTDKHGQQLPQKGDVDIILGGPPCQGFSGMNRFNYRQYSLFKNSLIATFLSYCDYYRPKYFILENVRNFVAFKKAMVLKLTLRCLVRMGYQCTFGVLQAGNYGVPQTRRRTIIVAAAPGERLPTYPEPYHVFTVKQSNLSVAVDDKRYVSNIKWTSSAPFRPVTVWDSMSDLPPIENGEAVENISYTGPPDSSFQLLVRRKSGKTLSDHICKEMSSLVEARIRHIPLLPGSDWRDLPNISIKLKDGKYTNKLKYMYNDLKNGKSLTGAKRGVCPCAEGKPCDPMDRQFNTLIPWCLCHTGNRHGNWSALYGRLNWDGYFSTTVTNPEPMGKQGCVLHPEQNRVVSVRECARSQGFMDSYVFYGSITDRHKQIGNAVPPPLALAIALEIKKCILSQQL